MRGSLRDYSLRTVLAHLLKKGDGSCSFLVVDKNTLLHGPQEIQILFKLRAIEVETLKKDAFMYHIEVLHPIRVVEDSLGCDHIWGSAYNEQDHSLR